MYFMLGLLTAGLLVLLVTPAMWRRAARLTRARIERSLPMSLAEIQSEKDRLRAEHAVSTRQLEITLQQLRDTSASHISQFDSQKTEIQRLGKERDEFAALVPQLEERMGKLSTDLASTANDLTTARGTIAEQETAFAERTATLATVTAELEKARQLIDEQRLEIVARNTEIANLGDQIEAGKARELSLAGERDQLNGVLATERAALEAERLRASGLDEFVGRLKAELAELQKNHADRLAELERRAEEVTALEASLSRERVRADGLAARLRGLQIEQEEGSSSFVAPALPPDGDNVQKAIAAAEAEKATLTGRIASLEAELSKLAGRNQEIQQELASEREAASDNATLRASLARLASDVVRLAGRNADEPLQGSPSINGETRSDERNGTDPVPLHRPPEPVNPVPSTNEGNALIERIRGFQQSASGR